MKRALFIVLVLLMMGITFVPSWARLNAPTAPTAITVNIASPANNAVVTANSTRVNGTSTPGSTLLLTIDGGTPVSVTADAAGNWSYTATGLAQGNHSATIEAQVADRFLYANSRSAGGNVYVFDTEGYAEVDNIPTYSGAEGIAAHARSGHIYACTSGSTMAGTIMTIVNGVNIGEVPATRCSNMITNHAQNRLYVAVLDGWIDVYDITGGQNPVYLSRITLSSSTSSAIHDPVFDPTNSDRLWVTAYGSLNTYLIQLSTASVIRTCPQGGRRMTISDDGTQLYIADQPNSTILVVNAATCQQIRTISGAYSTNIEDLDLSPDRTEIWANPRESGRIFTTTAAGATGSIYLNNTGTAFKGGLLTSRRLQKTFVAGNNAILVLNANKTVDRVLPVTGEVYEFALGAEVSTDQVNFSVDLTSDLSLAKRHLGQNFVVGQQGQYVFTVTNAGPAAADAPITISDTLPAGLTPVAVQTPNWTSSINGQVVTLTRSAPIPANVTTQPITVTVNIGAQAIGRVTNTACVSAPNDDEPANNCGSDIVTIVPVADVSIRKTSDTQFVVGRTGTYTLTIQNNGPSISSAPITVTDTLPSGLSYLSAVGAGWQCSNTGQTFRCISSMSLAANTTATSIVVRVNVLAPAAPSVTNTAVVSTTTTDTVPSNNTSTITTPVVAIANVNIRKTSDSRFVVGQTGTYTLTVGNTGPSISIAPITVTDVLPMGLSYLSAAVTGWQCSNAGQALTCVATTALAVNATAPPIVVRVNVLTPAAPAVTNTARVTGTTPDPDPTNNISTVTTPVLVPSVAIGKVANPPSGTWIAANQLITYTLRITNTGTLTLTNLLVSDSVPQYTTYITNSAQPIPRAQTSPLRWQFAALAPGAIRTMSFVVRVQARGDITEVRNIATITSDQTPTTPSNEIVHPFDPTAINLTSFTVSHFPQRHAAWTTASEHGTAGFNLYYTFQPSFTADHRVNAYVIPATGSPTQGAAYNHLLNVRADVPLYFWLEEVEQNGTPTVYGPEVLSPMYQMFVPMISR